MMPAVHTRYFTAAQRRTLAQVNENLPFCLRASVFRATEDGQRFDVGNIVGRDGMALYSFSVPEGAPGTLEVEGVAVPSVEAMLATVLSWERARLV